MTDTDSTDSTDTLSSKYVIVDHIDHVLNYSDTYLGSKDLHIEKLNIIDIDKDSSVIEERNISYIPAIFKIFDEILVNAADQKTRLDMIVNSNDFDYKIHTVKNIWVVVTKTKITVKNDGMGLDVEKIPEQDNKYPGEIIFGNLLAGTNFHSGDKLTGGKNGYGAKLANIFSTQFILETVDSVRKKKYCQKFENNMSVINKPSIRSYSGKPYTQIEYDLDFSRFSIDEYSDDIMSLFKKRVYDISCWVGKSVNVYYNGLKLNLDLESYIKLYKGVTDKNVVVSKLSPRWEIGITTSNDDILQSMSFVNGINTYMGGKHVDCIVDLISKKIIEHIKKKKKIVIKPCIARTQMYVFIKAAIVNPSFTSQTKEYCSTPKNKFGSIPEISQKLADKIISDTDIVKNIIENHEYKNKKKLKVNDGSKKNKIVVDKLSDANFAGGNKSYQCTLILTEGDSAKTMAISGLSDRNYYGVFPLRGKLLNTKDMKVSRIDANTEITNFKKIMGLKSDFDYSEYNETNWPLRYGRIKIMTDQDKDGFHIKGLLLNMVHSLWPSLLKKDIVSCLLTPIIKVTKGKIVKSFYNENDYEDWKVKTKDLQKWKIKYYKGLGTSNSVEAKQYFKDDKNLNYIWDNDVDTNGAMDLAFNKKNADKRKEWLSTTTNEVIDYNNPIVSIKNMVNKELIFFSHADNKRSLPDVIDGLKTTTRKILYGCFKRGLFGEKNEIKVSQLSGYISEHAAYHHGEMSLQGTIINMAQTFVGSNNYSILVPCGQFGSRLLGGKDASSSRYIFTYINKNIDKYFNRRDEPLYDYTDDDGFTTEPVRYVPVIPWILINGSHGIGTGYSTHIPCHQLSNVIKCTNKIWNGEDVKPEELPPHYEGFGGGVKRVSKNKYITSGVYKKIASDTILITELPIGKWTEDYINFLNTKVVKKEHISNYTDNSTEKTVKITIKLRRELKLSDMESHIDENGFNEVYKIFKLTESKTCNYGNMYMFDPNYSIKKYNDVIEIIKDFVDYRKSQYEKRKQYEVGQIKKKLIEVSNKFKFISMIVDGKLVINNRPKCDLVSDLASSGFDKIEDSYDYLLNMNIYQLTKENFEALKSKHGDLERKLEITEKITTNKMWKNDITELKVKK